jgi:hypothetical protein
MINNLKQYRDLVPGEMIFVGGDTSAGLGDRSVCQFFSAKKLDVPMVYSTNSIATEMTGEIVPILEYISDTTGYLPLIAYERQNGGVFEMDRLARLNKQGKYAIFQMPTYGNQGDSEQTVKLGWDTNSATRPQMLSALKEAVDNRLIRIYDKETIEEFFSFILVHTSTSVKAQAERNAYDDKVMSLAIAYQMFQLTPDYSKYLIGGDSLEKYYRNIQNSEVQGY